jgi:ABC-type Mn2+/Zn2+ transport system permease subunit
VAHATLPGVGLAFIVMVAFGGDGRSLPGLLAGSALTAWIGLLLIEWITRRTRLAEDAAIGAVLGVFFGLGIVLLTVIQSMSAGRQAGLEGFLLGSTAGMLFQDAVIIAVGGALAVASPHGSAPADDAGGLRPDYAAAMGYDVRRIDLLMMGLVMAVTVIGLKLVGLILIVAMLIIPPSPPASGPNARTASSGSRARIGGASGYLGAALSASAPALPTGPIIVLVAAALFVVSLLFAPGRGVLAAASATAASRRGCTAARACWRSPRSTRSVSPTRCACCAARGWCARRRRHRDRPRPGRQGRPRRAPLGRGARDPPGCGPDRPLRRADPHRGGLHRRRDRRVRPPARPARAMRPSGSRPDGGRLRPVLADADPDRHASPPSPARCRATFLILRRRP